MRAVVMRATGGVEVLEVSRRPRPLPGAGSALIRVRAASVNPIDWKYRRGLVERELPAVLGEDFSGTVAAAGPHSGVAAGDEVFGLATGGAQAEYTLAGPGALAPRPVAVGDEQAAALGVSGLTAWQGLFDRGGLAAGQTVVVAGAAGGIGHLAVQLARVAGAGRVIGSGSERNREFVLGLGADEFLDYRRGETTGGADLVLDTVGGTTTASLVPMLRDGGTLVTISYPPEAAPATRRIVVAPLAMRPDGAQLARIAALAASGAVRVELAKVLALGEVRRAHELSESGHVRGKLVLRIS
jgi:NADPH:quinone reductase-like Zn-dependent oxidoreductase